MDQLEHLKNRSRHHQLYSLINGHKTSVSLKTNFGSAWTTLPTRR